MLPRGPQEGPTMGPMQEGPTVSTILTLPAPHQGRCCVKLVLGFGPSEALRRAQEGPTKAKY